MRKIRNAIAHAWSEAGTEPPLAEVLADPLVHQVMRRDGVTPSELQRIIRQAQAQLRSGPCRCLAA
jgi:hypothetical protein